MNTHDESQVNRDAAGRFDTKAQSAPEASLQVLHHQPKVAVDLSSVHVAPVPYPDDIPAGGELVIGVDDAAGEVYSHITWSGGETVMAGGTPGDRWHQWDSVSNGEEAGFDDTTNERVLAYLRDVNRSASTAVERLNAAVFDQVQTHILAGLTPTR